MADQQIDTLIAQRRGQGPLTPAVEVAVNNIRLPEWERKEIPFDGQRSPEAQALIQGSPEKQIPIPMRDALAKFHDPNHQPTVQYGQGPGAIPSDPTIAQGAGKQ
jgi:hypothetical protein